MSVDTGYMRRRIRPAAAGDLDRIMEILDAARGIMRSDSNYSQWSDGYPSRETIGGDISRSCGYVIEDEDIVAYFAFVPSPEPTYGTIYGGAWVMDDEPYFVIHRLASTPDSHGIFASVMRWALERCSNLRIDTHEDNRIMRKLIARHGFSPRGIILLSDGSPRLAYQLVR